MYVPAGAPSIAYVPFAFVTARRMVGAPLAFRSIACTVRPATGRPVSSATTRPVKRPGAWAESAAASARHQETTLLVLVIILISLLSADTCSWLNTCQCSGPTERAAAGRPTVLAASSSDAAEIRSWRHSKRDLINAR